jgi:ABC-type lipoprotein export system ATPase subunit
LSGAEAKMLDLACIWAFRDILKLQGSVSYNVAFYDEILDSSMDSTNSEIVCSILNEIARQEHQATYVITHKTELMKGVSGEVIRLQKQNGITRRSDG